MFVLVRGMGRNTPDLLIAILMGFWRFSPIYVLAMATEDGKERIVGGEDAKAHEFPSYVSFRYRGGRSCGASVINQDLACHSCPLHDFYYALFS